MEASRAPLLALLAVIWKKKNNISLSNKDEHDFRVVNSGKLRGEMYCISEPVFTAGS